MFEENVGSYRRFRPQKKKKISDTRYLPLSGWHNFKGEGRLQWKPNATHSDKKINLLGY